MNPEEAFAQWGDDVYRKVASVPISGEVMRDMGYEVQTEPHPTKPGWKISRAVPIVSPMAQAAQRAMDRWTRPWLFPDRQHWPDVERWLFPRWTAVEDRAIRWRGRISDAWSVLRGHACIDGGDW